MKSKEFFTPLAIGASAVVIGLGATGCGGLSKEQAQEQSIQDFNKVYSESSPIEKYVLSMGMVTVVRQSRSDLTGNTWKTSIGSDCLDGTAYDVDGGTISAKLYGLFSYYVVEGKVPTALAVADQNPDNDDEIIITAGKEDVEDLVFEGLNQPDRYMQPTEIGSETVDTEKKDPILVNIPPPSNMPKDIVFHLIPANEHTSQVVKTYGCELGTVKTIKGYN